MPPLFIQHQTMKEKRFRATDILSVHQAVEGSLTYGTGTVLIQYLLSAGLRPALQLDWLAVSVGHPSVGPFAVISEPQL